jgi:hypothetical protein
MLRPVRVNRLARRETEGGMGDAPVPGNDPQLTPGTQAIVIKPYYFLHFKFTPETMPNRP